MQVRAVHGDALGEAFQLRDGLIDAFGDSALTGKPARLDFARQKMTLLVALAMQRDDRISRLLAGQGADGSELAQVITDLDVRGEVEDRIGHLVKQAQAAIAEAPLEPGWRDELAQVAVQVAYRQK